jgi:transposase-like protein
MSGGSSRRYPPELRERAVRMVAEISDQHDSEWAAISEVARYWGSAARRRCASGYARARLMAAHGREPQGKSPPS